MKIEDLEILTKEELREGLCNISIQRAKVQASLEMLEDIKEMLDVPAYKNIVDAYHEIIDKLTKESRVYLDAISFQTNKH